MPVRFEIGGTVYTLNERQGEILAENLRGFAHGNFPDDVLLLGPNEEWLASAREAADWIESWLVDEPDSPFPLEPGKTAESIYQALRLMFLDGGGTATDAAAMRQALHQELAAASIYVFESSGMWHVDYGGGTSQTFPTDAEALDAARSIAERERRVVRRESPPF